jgi:hypothetical protein
VFGLGPATRIYLAAGATDMRKGFEGLSSHAAEPLTSSMTSGRGTGLHSCRGTAISNCAREVVNIAQF